jgi:hypothetical protein
MSLIEELRDENPVLVMEQPGDGAYGIVLRVGIKRSNYRPEGYPVVTVKLLDSRVIDVHGKWTVLARLINDLNLRSGDEFAVVYDGERESATGQTYRVFRAESKRPAR